MGSSKSIIEVINECELCRCCIVFTFEVYKIHRQKSVTETQHQKHYNTKSL